MILIIAYDLHNPDRDYPKVEGAIKTAGGGWAHPQRSVWFVDTTEGPATWRDRLHAAADSNDEFFVAHLQQNWASWSMDKPVADWLKSPSRH